jgi:hypothetical protein
MSCCCNQNGNAGNSEDLWVFGTQFTSQTDYSNPLLKGRFRLKMRGQESLIRKTEWDYLPDGGFKVFIVPGWVVTPDVVISIEFY